MYLCLRQVAGKKRADSWKQKLRPGVELVGDAIDTARGVPQGFLGRGILSNKYATSHRGDIKHVDLDKQHVWCIGRTIPLRAVSDSCYYQTQAASPCNACKPSRGQLGLQSIN